MEPRYSVTMRARQSPLPLIWLLSDARNDAGLEHVLERMPRGSGFVFRHYHLDHHARAARFDTLAKRAKEFGHTVILARDATMAASLGADGIYGDTSAISGATGLMRLATAHDGAELQAAIRAGAHGIFLSPVFPTRSHPGGETLGAMGFHVLAQQSPVPVIALGGMSESRARELDWPRWGAIDGLASTNGA